MDPFGNIFSFINNTDSRKKGSEDCKNIEKSKARGKKTQNRKHNQNGKFKCTECEFTSNTKQSLTQHNEVVHMDIKRFYCKSCSYQSYYKHNMRYHIGKNHKSALNKFGRIGCGGCGNIEDIDDCNDCAFKEQSTKRKTRIKKNTKHKNIEKRIARGKKTQNRKHNQNGKFKCTECEFTSNTKQRLTQHNEAVHMDIKRFYCKSCPYQSYHKHIMRFHIDNNHKSALNKFGRIGCDNCSSIEDLNGCNECTLQKTRGKPNRKHNQNGETSEVSKNKFVVSCEDCKCTFYSIESFKDHESDRHSDIARFLCNLCDYMGFFKFLLQEHQKDMHKELNTRVIKIGCEECENDIEGHLCDSKEDVKEKEDTESSQKGAEVNHGSALDEKLNCLLCEFSSNDRVMMRHTQRVHLNLLRYECEECSYRTFYKKYMIKHIKLKHQQENQNASFIYLTCTLCTKEDDHEEHHYTRRKDKYMKKKNRRTLNERKNRSIKPRRWNGRLRNEGSYKCTENNCDFASDYKQSLKMHVEQEHEGIARFKCNICSYENYYKHTVAYHQKTHSHNKIKVLRIGCTFCEDNVPHSEHSNEKERIRKKRTGIKGNLKCLDCSYVTYLKQNLTFHYQRAHTAAKYAYSCNLCSFKCNNTGTVKRHQMSNHRGEKTRVIGIGCKDCEENIEHKRHLLPAKPFNYGQCFLCRDGVEHSEHEFTTVHSTESGGGRRVKYTSERTNQISVEGDKKKKSIISKPIKPRRWNGRLRNQGSLKCTEDKCDFASDYKQSLKMHVERDHKGIVKYKCNICDYENYHKHLVAHHQKTSSHSDQKMKILRIGCTFCEDDVFHTEHSNQEKRNTKERKGIKGNLKCLDCSYVTYIKQNLTFHYQRAHTASEKYAYSCNLCSFKSNNTVSVKRHQMSNHKGEKTRVIGVGCKDCEEDIEHKRHVLPARPFDYGQCFLCRDGVEHSEHEFTTVHSTGSRGGPRGEYTSERKPRISVEGDIGKCSICDIKLRNKKFHVQHYQKEHPNEKIYNCKDCKYATNYLPNLNTHTSSIHEKKMRQCPHCSYNTTWNTSFLEHMRSAHASFQKKSKHFVESEGQPILCDDCGFSTFNQTHFKAHKEAACNSQALIHYYRFKSSSHMRHSSIKINEGNFKCNKCEFNSDKPEVIRDHVQKIHTRLQKRREDKKPKEMNLDLNQDIQFKCNKCKYQTSEPTQLRDHMSLHT